jgi:hypothetical protein
MKPLPSILRSCRSMDRHHASLARDLDSETGGERESSAHHVWEVEMQGRTNNRCGSSLCY